MCTRSLVILGLFNIDFIKNLTSYFYSYGWIFFRCKGLILLETYSSLKSDVLKSSLPKFLHLVKEVTGDPNYSMFNLSLKEDWSIAKEFCDHVHGKEKNSRYSSNVNATTRPQKVEEQVERTL